MGGPPGARRAVWREDAPVIYLRIRAVAPVAANKGPGHTPTATGPGSVAPRTRKQNEGPGCDPGLRLPKRPEVVPSSRRCSCEHQGRASHTTIHTCRKPRTDMRYRGGGGIRTPEGRRTPLPNSQFGAFGHSATPPREERYHRAGVGGVQSLTSQGVILSRPPCTHTRPRHSRLWDTDGCRGDRPQLMEGGVPHGSWPSRADA